MGKASYKPVEIERRTKWSGRKVICISKLLNRDQGRVNVLRLKMYMKSKIRIVSYYQIIFLILLNFKNETFLGK